MKKAAGDIRQPFCKAVKNWWKVVLIKKKTGCKLKKTDDNI